jgi:hypothetical protein
VQQSARHQLPAIALATYHESRAEAASHTIAADTLQVLRRADDTACAGLMANLRRVEIEVPCEARSGETANGLSHTHQPSGTLAAANRQFSDGAPGRVTLDGAIMEPPVVKGPSCQAKTILTRRSRPRSPRSPLCLPDPLDKPCKNYQWVGSQSAPIGTPPQKRNCATAQMSCGSLSVGVPPQC